jgi:hypothetical protein
MQLVVLLPRCSHPSVSSSTTHRRWTVCTEVRGKNQNDLRSTQSIMKEKIKFFLICASNLMSLRPSVFDTLPADLLSTCLILQPWALSTDTFIFNMQCMYNITLKSVRESFLLWKRNHYYLLICACMLVLGRVGVCMRISSCSLQIKLQRVCAIL